MDVLPSYSDSEEDGHDEEVVVFANSPGGPEGQASTLALVPGGGAEGDVLIGEEELETELQSTLPDFARIK